MTAGRRSSRRRKSRWISRNTPGSPYNYRVTRHYFAAIFSAAFLALAPQALATVYPLEGATPQHAPPKVHFPNPIGVYVTDADGHPVPQAHVRWLIPGANGFAVFLQMDGQPSCQYDAGWF